MMKSIKTILSQDKERYQVPKKVQDVIPVRRIWPDGIFQVGSKFAKSWKFTDINYLVASREDKESMFLTYSELLNSLDSGATTKITINNHHMKKSDFEESILMEMKDDGLDEYRREYNQMLLDKAMDANGIQQEKYITVTVAKKNIEEARAYFARTGAELSQHFAALGSKCTELNANDRLRILHDFYRSGEENAFSFDMKDNLKKGHSFRDYICPDSIEKTADHLRLGERYARVLFLKDYASYIKDSMVAELTDLNRNMMLSIDIIPVPTDEAVREVENRLLGVETNITNWQRKQNQNNNFSAVVPYDMELQRKESKEFLDDLTTRDQRMMFAVITMVITADTKEQLDADTETILSTARKHMCQMATLKYQQIDGLNTVLPIGTRRINAFRTLTTESLAVFIPFKVQEIMDKGGVYFGENAISHNLIMCNKENLLNQSAFVLGVPGSGKSFSVKELISFLILNTEDDILICDPEGEYAPLIKAMGDLGSVIRVSAGGRDRLNAMYMVDGYGENNPIVVKSEFVMSLIEQIDKKGVGPQHKSIIDRCIANVYRNAAETGTVPTLCTLREMLLEQPEQEAKQIALSLELYTTGSLDIFGHQSNVDLEKRVVVFDIHGLGAQLKPTGLLVITDTMLNRVTLNWKRGKRTHVFIDEFHVVFENEFSAQFFNSAWRQFRKRNAYPTAITQNVEYLLDSVQASTMLSNSEFIVMLNQAASDRGELAKLLNISNEQMSYITNADPGCGLIKYGGSLVPFVNRFPKNTKLYQLMTTRPGEGIFAGQVS
jgi:type IV secretory pathway VirB4 component